jgi:uncharacterized membrane protein YgcG
VPDTEIVLVTTPDYGAFANNVDFAADFGNKHGIGKTGSENGVVIVFSKAKREAMISTGYGNRRSS